MNCFLTDEIGDVNTASETILPCLADQWQETKLGFFLQSPEESAEATHGEVELRGLRCSWHLELKKHMFWI